ncbi:hypothetical protein ACKUEM_26280, partial [Escherichia coli]|uniref:hypothetical protein n=1 Tax=Escherichia coli TaxID=562 RepID=UPI00390C8B88
LIRAVKRTQGVGVTEQRMLKRQEACQKTVKSGLQESAALQETMKLLDVNPTLAHLLYRNQGL